jgi:uroporphyrin-III C-methyltransferase
MAEGASISGRGTVYLVGAGPGDPDLLTLRAARLIGAAELIVHDGLVDEAILALAPAGAELISVAKSRARHTLPQDEINALLVREALSGRDVVRLKGGDPFIFGRGGEEMDACTAAGVPVEVVPGISAAIGCAAEAHLPSPIAACRAPSPSSPGNARGWPSRTGRASREKTAPSSSIWASPPRR